LVEVKLYFKFFSSLGRGFDSSVWIPQKYGKFKSFIIDKRTNHIFVYLRVLWKNFVISQENNLAKYLKNRDGIMTRSCGICSFSVRLGVRKIRKMMDDDCLRTQMFSAVCQSRLKAMISKSFDDFLISVVKIAQYEKRWKELEKTSTNSDQSINSID